MGSLADFLSPTNVQLTARIGTAVRDYTAKLILWAVWMGLAILSLFTGTWLVFIGLISWLAVPATACFVFAGLLAHPVPPVFEEKREVPSVRDNA